MAAGHIEYLEKGGHVPKPTIIAPVQDFLHMQEKPVTDVEVAAALGIHRDKASVALFRLYRQGFATRKKVRRRPKVLWRNPTNPRHVLRSQRMVWVYEAVQDK